MNIIEVIKSRKSCRTFSENPLSQSDKKVLEDFIRENREFAGVKITDLKIIEKKDTDKILELNYGLIKGHNTYLLGVSKSSPDSRVRYGYLAEKVVLKAAETGISSCWIGYFDHAYFNEINVEEGFEIPGIVILGYPKDKETRLNRIARFAVNASKRMSREKLFFDYNSRAPLKPDLIKEYSDSLEMTRLAPSSGNTQPWRIFFDSKAGEFHFFKKIVSKRYEARGLHDIDMGIALSHFELTSLHNNLSGSWIKLDNEIADLINELQYIISWKCA